MEIGSPDEVLDRPDWLGEEVTDHVRYYNFRLAAAPFSHWPDTDRRAARAGRHRESAQGDAGVVTLGPLMIDLKGVAIEPDERDLLMHPLTGGVILFTRNYENPAQLTRLTEEIHALRSVSEREVQDQGGHRYEVRQCHYAVGCHWRIKYQKTDGCVNGAPEELFDCGFKWKHLEIKELMA